MHIHEIVLSNYAKASDRQAIHTVNVWRSRLLSLEMSHVPATSVGQEHSTDAIMSESALSKDSGTTKGLAIHPQSKAYQAVS